MSEDQLKAFLEKVREDTSLQDKIKAAKTQDEVVLIAKAEGLVISADQLTKGLSSPESVELSDDQLAMVSGGDYYPGQKTNEYTEFWLEVTKNWFKK
jgi:predicted ribosomally synthesized peptide with nif11-like leader